MALDNENLRKNRYANILPCNSQYSLFNSLKTLSCQCHRHIVTVLRYHKYTDNVFLLLFSVDSTRVVLNSCKDNDYINASFIKVSSAAISLCLSQSSYFSNCKPLLVSQLVSNPIGPSCFSQL